jgi:Zn-dependent protease with chaperone function
MSQPTACRACGAFTTGIDCETCGAPSDRACPACSRVFQLADRYCTSCGHCLAYTNFSNQTLLRFPRELPLEAFQYPPDRAALRMLAKAGPLKAVARFLQEHWSEPYLLGNLEGTAVQVTAKQFPQLRRLADTCQRILHLPPTEVFIQHSASLSASAIGSEKASAVVLTSGLVENLNERELLFVLGREMGHIRAEHMFYLNMVKLFTDSRILQSIPFFSEGLRAFVVLFLLPWQRKSQVTADRAGLLCCQNRLTAIKALIKMTLGAKSLYDKVDIEAFLGQADEVATRRFSVRNMGEYMSGSPFVTSRVRELEDFCFSVAYHSIMATALNPYLPGFECPACKVAAYPDNLEEGLVRLSCKACGAAVPVLALPCPHCGGDVEAGEVGLRDRNCPACQKPFLSSALRELLPETGECYRILGVPSVAGREEFQQAFVRLARQQTVTREKLPYYRAYHLLEDPARRKAYDEKLLYLGSLELRRRRGIVLCNECDCPVTGEHCGWCGTRKGEGRTARAAAAAPATPAATPVEPAPATREDPPPGPIN